MRNYEILKVAFAEDNLLFEYYVFFLRCIFCDNEIQNFIQKYTKICLIL